VDAEVNERRAADAPRVADVAADEATADEAHRRNEDAEEGVKGPRSAGLLGNLASSEARNEVGDEANLPVGETATQRLLELAHRMHTCMKHARSPLSALLARSMATRTHLSLSTYML